MSITEVRTQSTFMYMVRAVVLVSGTPENGVHEVTASPVEADDSEPDARRLDADPDGVQTLADYAARTTGQPWVFQTSEPNRWVVGELMFVKVKPVR